MRTGLSAPTESEVTSLRGLLADRFSLDKIAAAFLDETAKCRPGGVSSRADYTHVPPGKAALEQYREQTYPAWIEASVEHLLGLLAKINLGLPASVVRVHLSNSGFRPAENVRIRFSARGPFLIAPVRDNGYPPLLGDLPAAPKPPHGHWMQGAIQVATATPIREAIFNPSLYDLGLHRLPTIPRQDESWYWEPERPEVPVESFDLECNRFRHGVDPEPFELLLFPQQAEPTVRGALTVQVSASNVSRPLDETFPIELQTNFSSSLAALTTYVDEQDLLKATT